MSWSTNKPLHEQLASMVESAWAAYTDGAFNDVKITGYGIPQKSGMWITSYPNKKDALYCTSARLYHPSIALLEKRSMLNGAQRVTTDIVRSHLPLCAPVRQITKLRPLLRQKEEAAITHLPIRPHSCPTDSYLTNEHTYDMGKVLLPKRQHVPKKEDAIYNARYKTQPCLHYQKNRRCPLGENCHFAHGPGELLHPQAHPKYRTRLCANFVHTGFCPFEKNCYFLHSTTLVPDSLCLVKSGQFPRTL
ncbi:unnamed protein product [Dicrocoelium dendriticum]|nr:unnamed protein product [Dicrocoelium dendriticum]